MRLNKLNLIRYGHFQDRELEFAESGLTIVYGPNEAGKSTTLDAISDLLYGFNRLCPYNFQFEHSKLRLGGKIVNRSGDELTFLRRKANTATIMDVSGTPLPDSVLGPFLGQSDKEFFQKSFGLSHDRLREGGEAVEKAEGDLGKILFEAGSGITNLTELQAMLEEAASGYFGPKKGANKLIYQTLDAYNEAHSALKEATLKSQDWQLAQRNLAEARQALGEVQTQFKELTTRQAKLNRWLRVLPILREMNTNRDALEATGALVLLPGDARAKYSSAVQSRIHAETSLDERQKRLEELTVQLEESAIDENLLSASDTIQRLYEGVAVIEHQLELIPQIKASTSTLKEQMMKQAERMELPIADGLPQLPKTSNITQLASLVAQRQQLDTRLQKATEDEVSSAGQVELLEQQLAQFASVTDPTSDVAVFQKLQTSLAALPEQAKLQREIEKFEKKIANGLTKLAWWTGDTSSLLKLKLPSKAHIDQHRRSLAQAEKQVEAQADKVKDADAQLKEARRKLEQLRKRQVFYSESDLRQARETRQAAWQLVRRTISEKLEPTNEEIAKFGAGNALVPVYEALTEQADVVADARLDSVGTAVKHENLQEQVETHEQQVDDVKAKLNEAEAALKMATEAWEEVWRSLNIQPEHPDVMLESMAAIESISEAVTLQEEAAAERNDAMEMKDRILQQLRALAGRIGIEEPANTDADILLVQIESSLAERSASFRKAESLIARHAEQKQMLDKHKKALADLATAVSEWQKAWSASCLAAKLSPDLSTDQVNDAISVWGDLRQKQDELERRRTELHAAEIQVEQFIKSSSSLSDNLRLNAELPTASEAIKAIRGIYSSFVKMQQVATLRTELETQIAEVKAAKERSETAMLTANAELSVLMDLAGVSKEDDLPAAIDTAERQRRLQSDIDASHKRLIEASEGEDEESLIAACGELTTDEVRAELGDVETELESIKLGLETAVRNEADAQRIVAELEAKSGAADCAQKMQNAAAKMGVQVRDYLRLQAASTLLRHGIERIRDKHKNPILAKGSEFFSTLTTGSFAGLATDYDTRGNPIIVGVRPTGEHVNVAGMSDGTRDQLYLALRLAFVENYCATKEPLPFIGDDLFINFDDERTAAGLQLLAQLKHCQVILFTHHEHVKNLAKAELDFSARIQYLDLLDPDPLGSYSMSPR